MDLVALPGLEPGLFALRGRRVNQLHHNAKNRHQQEDFLSSTVIDYSRKSLMRAWFGFNFLLHKAKQIPLLRSEMTTKSPCYSPSFLTSSL